MALNLVQGNRRTRNRTTLEETDCYITFEKLPEKTFSIKMESISFGGIQISLDTIEFDEISSLGYSVNFQIRRNGELYINGSWNIEEIAKRNNRIYIRMTLQRAKELLDYEGHLSPENIFLTNRYRLISATSEAEAEAFSRHLADIKDCPVSVNANIFTVSDTFSESEATKISGTFDFSSGSKQITQLDFLISNYSKRLEIKQKVKVDYEFLGARFTFLSLVNNVDTDFGIISLEIPQSLLSLTARHFDRVDTDIKATVSSLNCEESTNCCIRSISAKGAELHFESEITKSNLFSVGNSLKLLIENGDPIAGNITNIRGKTLGLSFSKEKDTLPVKRQLLKKAVDKNFTVREVNNYPNFLSLYEEIGYGAPNSAVKDAWETQSKSVWEKQDSILPGNTVAFGNTKTLLGCSSALPMSKNTIVIHSVGVVKDVQALPRTLELLNYCHSWIEMLSDIKTLCMCFRHKSRFMTRLHISAETHASPESTQIFPCVGYTGETKVAADPNFIFREYTPNADVQITAKFRHLYESINEVHPELESLQKIRLYQVFSGQEEDSCAVIAHHSAEPLFTAADTFRTAFCMILRKDCDLTAVVDAIGSNPLFINHEVCVFIDGAENHTDFSYKGKMDVAPLYLYLLSKSDLAPILASMHRFIYKTMRKYGEDSIEYLQKVVSA